jgi:hypothetical protein
VIVTFAGRLSAIQTDTRFDSTRRRIGPARTSGSANRPPVQCRTNRQAQHSSCREVTQPNPAGATVNAATEYIGQNIWISKIVGAESGNRDASLAVDPHLCVRVLSTKGIPGLTVCAFGALQGWAPPCGAASGRKCESAALVASNRVWMDYDGRIVGPPKPGPRAWNGSRILLITNRRSPS